MISTRSWSVASGATSGERAHARHQRGRRALLKQYLVAWGAPGAGGRRRSADWQRVQRGALMLAAGLFEWLRRAVQARRSSRRADGGFQLQVVDWSKSAGRCGSRRLAAWSRRPHFAWGRGLFILGRDPQEDALDIAVDYRDGLAESDAGDDRGGVLFLCPAACAGLLGGTSAGPLVLLDHHFGSLVRQLGTAVIAKPAPDSNHIRFLRPGLAPGDGRKPMPGAETIIKDNSHPGLLQHDLADPDTDQGFSLSHQRKSGQRRRSRTAEQQLSLENPYELPER